LRTLRAKLAASPVVILCAASALAPAQAFKQIPMPSNLPDSSPLIGYPNGGLSEDGLTLLGFGPAENIFWDWSATSNVLLQWDSGYTLTAVAGDSSAVVGPDYLVNPATGFSATTAGSLLGAIVAPGEVLPACLSRQVSSSWPENIVFGTTDIGGGLFGAFTTTSTGAVQLLPNPMTGLNMYPVACAATGWDTFGYIKDPTGASGYHYWAFRWSNAAGSQVLSTPGSGVGGHWTPWGCDDSGQVVAGIATEDNNISTIYLCATGQTYTITPATTNIGVSPDGKTVYGTFNDTMGMSHGFLWSTKTLALIADLGAGSSLTAGGNFRFVGYGIQNGSTVEGYYQLGYGWVYPGDVLSQYGLGRGWVMGVPWGISADGTRMYGAGSDPDGNYNYWYAVIPSVAGANNDAYQMNQGNTLTVAAPGVMGNDRNTYGATAMLVTPPAHGTVSLANDGSFQYTPQGTFNGVDRFTYVDVTYGASGNTATVTLNVFDPPSALNITPSTVYAGQTAKGTVTLANTADVPNVVILTSSNSAAKLPSSVTVPAGSSSASFKIQTTPIANNANYSAKISATYAGVKLSSTLQVQGDGVVSVLLSPDPVSAGDVVKGTVTLRVPSAAASSVSISSTSTSIQVPPSMSVPAGASSITFPVTTVAAASGYSGTITVSAWGTSASTKLTVTPESGDQITSLSVPAIINGGQTVNGKVTLTSAAPASGWYVALTSSNSAAATVPAFVLVPAGETSANFSVKTALSSSNASVTISAADSVVQKQVVPEVLGQVVVGLSLTPNPAQGNETVMGTVTLLNAAFSSGWKVNLSANSALVSVPPSVTVLAGQKSATFSMTTKLAAPNTSVTVTASDQFKKIQTTLTLLGEELTGLGINPGSVAGGQTATGTVTLSNPAPSGGWTINLASGNTSLATVPSSVTVAGGQRQATFKVTTRRSSSGGTVMITAEDAFGNTKTASIKISP
jgi:hypothetical protein